MAIKKEKEDKLKKRSSEQKKKSVNKRTQIKMLRRKHQQ